MNVFVECVIFSTIVTWLNDIHLNRLCTHVCRYVILYSEITAKFIHGKMNKYILVFRPNHLSILFWYAWDMRSFIHTRKYIQLTFIHISSIHFITDSNFQEFSKLERSNNSRMLHRKFRLFVCYQSTLNRIDLTLFLVERFNQMVERSNKLVSIV